MFVFVAKELFLFLLCIDRIVQCISNSLMPIAIAHYVLKPHFYMM